MPVSVVIGSQWGDEGKGKIIDYIGKDASYTIRFHGGNNAGHTVINKYGKFAMHLVPSGIFNPKSKAIIANGVIVDLEILALEIENLEKAKIKIGKRLYISPRCHIIMPYHKILDRLFEEAKGKSKVGTTGRGIGPCYADKVSYNGIRIADLLDKRSFREKLKTQLKIKNKILKSLGHSSLSAKKTEKEILRNFSKIKKYVKEPYPEIEKALKDKKNILLEGAHGVLLDNDWGTYPFVTASTVISGGIPSGSGIPLQKIGRVIGVAKAYQTRVGAGPMPTEQNGIVGQKLQEVGQEFGTTTGRKRRCGWLDLELLRFAAKINNFTELAITKLDVLDNFDKIKICTHYKLRGKKVNYENGDANFLNKVEPVYKTMKGWQMSTKNIKRYADLPVNAKKYIREIEKNVGVKASFISIGNKRNEIIKK